MKVGYCRVSTADQDTSLQLDALNHAGCDKIFTDHASGVAQDRPGLQEALDFVRSGDVLVVWKLDRLGRSLKHLITEVEGLRERGVEFMSITEGMDTSTNGGRLIFNIFGSLAEFERGLIRERTHAGLKAARARGRLGGRKKTITNKQIDAVTKLAETMPISDACKQIGIARQSYYRLK